MSIKVVNKSNNNFNSTLQLFNMVKNDLPKTYKEYHLYDNGDIIQIQALNGKQEVKALFVITYQTYPHIAPKSLFKVVNRKKRFTYSYNGQPGVNAKIISFYDSDNF